MVWLPSGYDDPSAAAHRWPVVVWLQGLVGQVDMWDARKAFSPTFPERIDALAPDCIVVLVDAWSSLGGAQFLDSPAVGNYSTYLCDDVVRWLDANYRTLPRPASRAVAGHSSGGYGAIVNAIARPDVWGHWISHAGDGLFEMSLWASVADVVRTLARDHGGSYATFWEEVTASGRDLLSRDGDFPLLNMWCMAACFSPDPDEPSGVALPFDVRTGEQRAAVWSRWLAHDPVRMVRDPANAPAIESWRSAWVDAGTRDEVHADLAAIALVDGLRAAGMGDDRLRFELHGGRHGGQDERFVASLAWLAGRLSR